MRIYIIYEWKEKKEGTERQRESSTDGKENQREKKARDMNRENKKIRMKDKENRERVWME